MSGVYLLILFSIWLFVGYVVYKLFRTIKKRESGFPVFSVITVVVLVGLWVGWPFWEMFGKKMYWDAKVRELCAIDGGIKVYERTVLPAVTYDRLEEHNWILPNKALAKPTDKYFYETETYYYRKKHPAVARTVTRIIRRSDGMVLGEYIRYGRGGGDLPGPWHGSSFLCPDPTKSTGFSTIVFVRGE